MNLLILEDTQFIRDDQAIANKRQHEHIIRILKLSDGAPIKIGRINQRIGQGIIRHNTENIFIDNISFTEDSPANLPISLVLAMPRPQMLKRIMQTVACLGVQEIHLIHTSRVEKGFWQSPSATDDAIRHQLILGLEQGMATQLPKVEKHLNFRSFINDALDLIAKDSLRLIAHPTEHNLTQANSISEETCLAIGPEGGFLIQEVQSFNELGFTCVGLGKRILKVETAIPVALAKLYPF